MKRICLLFATCCIGFCSIIGQPAPPPPPAGSLPPLQAQPAPPQGPMQAGLQSPAPGPMQPAPQTPPPPSATPPGWGAPGYLSYPPAGDWMNQGTINVMATGYDSESVLVQIPLVVSYSFNGTTYNVTVLNAWSPFTQTWNLGVDVPASPTSFYFNGFNYNYTVTLPSGVFYFNL